MISIDLEENNDAVMSEKSDKSSDIKNKLRFKRKLIFQVRKHRLLYDNKSKLFSNVAKKELVWQQIAKELSANADDCKNTWLDLRYSYQQHARRLHKFFMNGHKENRKRPAMYMESELMFLWRFIENRKTCKLQFEINENNSSPPTTEIEKVTAPPESPKLVEPPTETIEKETAPVTSPAKDTNETVNNKENDKNSNAQKSIDDDLILVEQPVELIVIDEDDDNNKSEKQFKVSPSMKLLIAQIKAYPELYDSENLAFKDYTRKSYIWNAIACNLGDKATKLMKCWIILQTRYEWEIWQTKQNTDNSSPPPQPSELQVELEFLKNYILNNPDTVYKQSYYLKTAWYDPIDYFKDIYNLIVRMKKNSDIVYITDSLLKTPEKSKIYLTLWSDIAILKGSTAGQCETTWLIMRHFYWELMYMRQQNYQLTDKWYFESIITELYAISKAAQTAKQQELQVLKQNKPMKKATKRPAQTPATSLGAPTTTRTVTTMQMTPTIVNNLPSVPASNSTLTTSSIVGQQPITFPKITAAISLAPQSLNTGTLQIKPISGPPNLSPAPSQPQNIINGTVVTTTTGVGSAPISMSFNLPTQTKVTSVPMPPLIRTVAPNASTQQPIIRNPSQAQITVRPRTVLRPVGPRIQITPITTTAGPTVNNLGNIQVQANKTATIVAGTSGATTATAVQQQQQQSIASFKITTLPSNNTTTNVVSTPATSQASVNNSGQLPKISGAISLLNPNEILIELIASQNGNQLVVHGPPLSAKYQLSMPTVAKFIREILAIPLLHNKRNNQPGLINLYWEHIGRKFNLPVHICRACWNFLLENFNHFPQIAPLKELMKPFQTSFNVWKESMELFKKFDEHCVSKGWLKYVQRLPEVVECISGYPVLYQDVSKDNSEKLSDMETLCAWRTISLRFPKIPEIQEIWGAIKTCFCQYMNDLEFGIDNKWPINWWRSLARLKFLVEARYTTNEPFYYIISNKMLEEIEKCAMLEMKTRYKNDSTEKTVQKAEDDKIKISLIENQSKNNDNIASMINLKGKHDFELGTLLTAIQKHAIILNKGAWSVAKHEAWKKVAKELHLEVNDCLLAFKQALKMYFAYKKQDSISRCRLNERYYKKLDDIVRNMSANKHTKGGRGKLNIKTPLELNQSVDTSGSTNSSDLVFPERFISDISMSNSPSNLVVKNWVYALGNVGGSACDNAHVKLKTILTKYLTSD
ncbi:hybrid male rescue isoform 2-T2 [Cochliomyia hominivorax]